MEHDCYAFSDSDDDPTADPAGQHLVGYGRHFVEAYRGGHRGQQFPV